MAWQVGGGLLYGESSDTTLRDIATLAVRSMVM